MMQANGGNEHISERNHSTPACAPARTQTTHNQRYAYRGLHILEFPQIQLNKQWKIISQHQARCNAPVSVRSRRLRKCTALVVCKLFCTGPTLRASPCSALKASNPMIIIVFAVGLKCYARNVTNAQIGDRVWERSTNSFRRGVRRRPHSSGTKCVKGLNILRIKGHRSITLHTPTD